MLHVVAAAEHEMAILAAVCAKKLPSRWAQCVQLTLESQDVPNSVPEKAYII